MSMSQKILEVLQSSPIPCSTPDLIAILATGKSHPRSRVWVHLRKLEKSGLVKRVQKRWDRNSRGKRLLTYWGMA